VTKTEGSGFFGKNVKNRGNMGGGQESQPQRKMRRLRDKNPAANTRGFVDFGAGRKPRGGGPWERVADLGHTKNKKKARLVHGWGQRKNREKRN